MERRASNVGASVRASRRRSVITVIAPGEETPRASGSFKDSPKSEHDTFDSFKAKPHPLPLSENTVNYAANPAPTGPPVYVMNGGPVPVNGGGYPPHNTAPPYAAAPVTQAVVPLPPLSTSPHQPQSQPKPQQVPNGSARRAASSRLADLHLFPTTTTSPSNGPVGRGNPPSRDTVNPVVAAPMPTRPAPLNVAAARDDGAHLRHSAPSGGAGERREASARGGGAARPEPVISALEVVGPRPNASRGPSNPKAPASEAPAAAPANGSGKGKAGATSARDAAAASAAPPSSSSKSNPQQAAVRHQGAAHRGDTSGSSQTPVLPQAQRRASAPPLQPGSTWTAAAQRQPLASARPSSSAAAEAASNAGGRRATVPQPRGETPRDIARVPRPPLRRPAEQPLPVPRRTEAPNDDRTDRSAEPSLLLSSKGDGSVASSASFHTTVDEDDVRYGATGDSSFVLDDGDADSPPDITADAAAEARTASPPPALSLYLLPDSGSKLLTAAELASSAGAEEDEASPVPSPLMGNRGGGVRLPSLGGARRGSSTAPESTAAESADASCASFASMSSDDVRSMADFSVVSDVAGFGTGALPPRIARKETRVFSNPTEKSAGGDPTAIDADISISNYGILGDDMYGSPVANNSVTPERLRQPQRRPPSSHRTSRDAAAGLPSPVELRGVKVDGSAEENEWSISVPLVTLSTRRRSMNVSSSSSSSTHQQQQQQQPQRHEGKTPAPTVLVESTSGPNADAGNPLVTDSYGNWSFSNASSARSGDATGDSAAPASTADTHPPAPRSTSPSLALSRGKQSAAAAAAAARKKAEEERWRVTQSLSIDPELFCSQSLAGKPSSTVARLRKVFESSKDRRARPATASTASSAAPSSVSSPHAKPQKTLFSPVNSVPRFEGSPVRTRSADSRKSSPPAPPKAEAPSRRASVNSTLQSPFSTAPSVASYNLSNVSPPQPHLAQTAKVPLPPLSPAGGQASGSDPHYSLTSSYSVGSPTPRRSGKDASRDWATARDSASALPIVSLQRSDPGFSLASFKDSNLSLDTVNMVDNFEP